MSKDTIITGTIAFIVGLGCGFYIALHYFFRDIGDVLKDLPSHSVPASSDVKVRALAKQFSWHFHYPGEDGVFGSASIEQMSEGNPLGLDPEDSAAADDIHSTELVLPCNHVVEVLVTSADVIHNLNLPDFRIQQDAIPGRDIPLFFQTLETPKSGRVKCGQWCGEEHEKHHAPYRIISEEEFQKWLELQGELKKL